MTDCDPNQLQRLVETTLGPEAMDHGLTFRPMFGGITAYTMGRNFASLSNVGLALKLDRAARDELLAVPGARPLQYDPGGPVSKSSVVVPESFHEDTDALRGWLLRSIDYCRTLKLPVRRKKRES